jgi:hypothetical protein
MEISMEVPPKPKLEAPYDSDVPLQFINPKPMKSAYNRDICIPTFIETLITLIKIWNQPRFLPTNE